MSELESVQLHIILAGSLYEQGKLSLGQAAELANMSKRRGVISAIKPILEKIKATNFRISAELELHILVEAKE